MGLGVGAHLERWGVPVAQVQEMDWWESLPFKGLSIHCTPAPHYSGRKAMDNSTLWTSWVVKGSDHSLYFSGVIEITPKAATNDSSRPKHAHHFKDVKIKIAGFGGQGVLLLGQLLIEMGMREALEVSWPAVVRPRDAFR